MGEPTEASVLGVHWSFGFNKEVINGVHNLSGNDRSSLFYLSSHSGLIYDFEQRSQMILQGHCNMISCCAVSKDKRWIVTADSGEDSLVVVWDSLTGAPVKTIFNPHANGVCSVDISDDALYVATLKAPSPGAPQEIAIWAWTRPEDAAVSRSTVFTPEKQSSILFNPFKQSELATTGPKTVCFWNWGEIKLEGYVGKVSKTDFGHFSGKLTSSVFLGTSGNALTCTDEGYTILWETQYATVLLDDPNDRLMRTASKVLRLVECGISTVHVINDYVAIACADGAVRFYDYFLRLEAWFEDFAAGPLSSLSFACQKCSYPDGEAGAPGLQFWVPDFIVGTTDAFIVGAESSLFDEIKADDRRGTLVMQGMSDSITSIACHPSSPLVVIASVNGSVQMWDYDMKILINLREFNYRTKALSLTTSNDAAQVTVANKKKSKEKEKAAAAAATAALSNMLHPQCIKFEPNGEFIAIGFESGNVKFINVETFEDVASFAPSSDVILGLEFSPSGAFLAAYDSSFHVIIFQRNEVEAEGEAEERAATFTYIGRIRSHKAAITGIAFGNRDGSEILVSVSADRHCVEYDLFNSTASSGIQCVGNTSSTNSRTRIDLTGRPTAIVWHPHLEDDVEDRFVVANDEYKFKEFNGDSKQCRRTTLAPTFGGAPKNLLPLPSVSTKPFIPQPGAERQTSPFVVRHYCYATPERIIGVGALPLDGSPANVMGLVGHPGIISDLAVSFDGKYIFSSGGASDLSVNMWNVDVSSFDKNQTNNELIVLAQERHHEENDALAIEEAENLMKPFYSLLEGGKGGPLYNEIVDYFYYCQIRSQGENSMDQRAIFGRILVPEIPSLMRAIGYYPSEEEVANMTNEIRYKYFMTTGALQFDISLEDFIKLYVNHKPLQALDSQHITQAFGTIASKNDASKKPSSPSQNWRTMDDLNAALGGSIPWDELEKILSVEGEPLSNMDWVGCLTALVGSTNAATFDDGDGGMSGQLFADKILGFENSESENNV